MKIVVLAITADGPVFRSSGDATLSAALAEIRRNVEYAPESYIGYQIIFMDNLVNLASFYYSKTGDIIHTHSFDGFNSK